MSPPKIRLKSYKISMKQLWAGSHYRLIFILAGSKKKVTQPEIKIKLTTLGSHFNQVKIKNVNHAGNLTAGKLTFPRTNFAAEQDTLHRDYSPVVFSYSTTTKSTACFLFAGVACAGRLACTGLASWLIFRVRWFGPYKLPEWWRASNVLLMWIKIVSWQRMTVKSWKICVGEEQISPVHNFMYARNTSACNGEISRSFLFLSFALYVTREHKMTTFDSTGCGSLCLKKIWQNRLAPPKHTGVFDGFLRFWNFLKNANVGSH